MVENFQQYKMISIFHIFMHCYQTASQFINGLLFECQNCNTIACSQPNNLDIYCDLHSIRNLIIKCMKCDSCCCLDLDFVVCWLPTTCVKMFGQKAKCVKSIIAKTELRLNSSQLDSTRLDRIRLTYVSNCLSSSCTAFGQV